MRRLNHWLPVVVLLFAALLRFTGLTFGQPDPAYNSSYIPDQINPQAILHPDEFLFVAYPLNMLLSGNLNTGFYDTPSFLINLNFVTYWLTDSGRGLTHEQQNTGNMREYAPFRLYIVGRVFSALSGVLSVAVVYAIGRRLQLKSGALFAALLVCVALPMVQYPHYATTTSIGTAFLLVAFYLAFLSLSVPTRWRWWLVIAAGACTGFAIGNRYNAAVGGIVLLLVGLLHFYRQRSAWRWVAVSWGVVPLAFIFTTPFVIFDFASFWQDVQFISSQYLQGSAGFYEATPLQGLWMEIRYLLVYGIGIPAALMLPIAGMYLWRNRADEQYRDQRILILFTGIYVILYSLLILRTVRPGGADQILLPVLPMVALFAGLGFEWVNQAAKRAGWIGQGVLYGVLLAVPLVLSVSWLIPLVGQDTREAMQRWVYEHLPRGASIHLIGPYNVPLDPADYTLDQSFGGTLTSLDTLLEQGVDYIVFSDAWFYDQYRYNEVADADYLQQVREYDESWSQHTQLVYKIDRLRIPGDTSPLHTASYWHQPGLRIYCLTEASCEAAGVTG